MINNLTKYGIQLKLVDIEDAGFIMQLRNNTSLNSFISPTSTQLKDQVNWIKEYKKREKAKLEYYFITIINGKKLGTTRLSELDTQSFELGSWVFLRESPAGAAVKADILTKEIGFETLGFDYCKFNVRKANKTVLKYHQHYQPSIVKEDDLDLYFQLSVSNFNTHKTKFLKLL